MKPDLGRAAARVNKFEAVGPAAAPSRLVRPPRVADVPRSAGVPLLLVLPITDLDGKRTSYTLILGQVVGVHIDPAFLKDGLFDIAAAGTIARWRYRGDYIEVTRVFEMLRPSRDGHLAGTYNERGLIHEYSDFSILVGRPQRPELGTRPDHSTRTPSMNDRTFPCK